jgi:flagellar biosynthetic protein FliR
MDLEPVLGYATSFLLHCVRVGAFFAVVPMFGRQEDSAILRVALTLSLGAIFWWVGDQVVEPPAYLLHLGVLSIREVVIGFALGFALSTLTSMLVSAGEIISSEMGFSMARAMNPDTGADTTVISQFLQVIGFLLILHFDIHHDAVRILKETFTACRIGEPFAFDPIWEGLRTLVSMSVMLALQYSLPILGVMMLLSVAMVLLGRAVPSINLMEFGFALRVLVALAVLAYFLVAGTPFLLDKFSDLLGQCRALFPS